MFSFDASFIEKLIIKDTKSFNEFYLQTVDVFFRYIKWSYTLTDADCHDILSDFYCKMRDILWSYDPTYSFEAYIWTIFKNLLKDYFKKHRETYFSSFDVHTEDDTISFADTLVLHEKDIETFLQENYQHWYIGSAIDQMDAESKDLLFWKFVENKSYNYIASILGMSVVNVRKKLSRIVAKLKQQLWHLKDRKD